MVPSAELQLLQQAWLDLQQRTKWPGALHPEQAPTQWLWEGHGAAAAAGLLQENKA